MVINHCQNRSQMNFVVLLSYGRDREAETSAVFAEDWAGPGASMRMHIRE